MAVVSKSWTNVKTLRFPLKQREAIEGFLYISPWILGFLIFTVGPMIASLFLSFTNYNVVSPPRFAGLSNYTQLLKDPLFWTSLGNTLYFTVLIVPLTIAGSLGCALLLNRQFIGRPFFSTVSFFASITAHFSVTFLR